MAEAGKSFEIPFVTPLTSRSTETGTNTPVEATKIAKTRILHPSMRHIRPLAAVEVSILGHPATFMFTRSFLADSFKGIRNREERPGEPHSLKSNLDGLLPTENVHSQQVSERADKSEPITKKPYSDKLTGRSVIYPKKYFLLVSPCLNTIRGEVSSSDSDDSSSSDSEDSEDRIVSPISRPDRLTHVTHPLAAASLTEGQAQVWSKQTSPDIDILNEDIDALYLQLTKLGLPTAFGSTKGTRVDSDYNQSESDSELRDDITLLRLARKYFRQHSCRPPCLMRRRSYSDLHSELTRIVGDSTTVCLSSLYHGNSSESLSDYRLIVFANLCYLLGLACSFEQSCSISLQMENLYLPRAWTSRDFNLEAFLYSCERYWRYEPSVLKPLSTNASSEKSSDIGISAELIKIGSDPQLSKYWAQRFRLFSRFNEGIQLDHDGFFSATPEAIAYHQAMRVKQSLTAKGVPVESLTVIDACSGTGANSIQFALVGFQVVAVEIDSERIRMAAHNAEIYGVQSKIKFVCADFFEWARRKLRLWHGSGLRDPSRAPSSPPYAALFMSPPWGGPTYLDSKVFDLNWIQFGPQSEATGCTFWFSIQLASQLTGGNVLLFLPRNSNMAQLPQFTQCLTSTVLWSNHHPSKLSVEIEVNVLNAKVKAISLYTGSLCNRTSDIHNRPLNALPSADAIFPTVKNE